MSDMVGLALGLVVATFPSLVFQVMVELVICNKGHSMSYKQTEAAEAGLGGSVLGCKKVQPETIKVYSNRNKTFFPARLPQKR